MFIFQICSFRDIKDKIIEYLQEYSQPVTLFQLVNFVFQGRYSSSVVDDTLSQLFEERRIIYTSAGIIGAPHNLSQLIEWVNNKDERDVLNLFFQGYSFPTEQKANVQQIVRGFLQNRCPIEEDSYKKVFQRYRFTQDSFCKIFLQPVGTYIYLTQICKKGKLDWRQIRLDESQSIHVQSAATSAIASEGLLLDDQVLPCSVEEIGLYLLRQHNAPVDKETLFLEYCNFLDQSAPLPNVLSVSKHRFASVLYAREALI